MLDKVISLSVPPKVSAAVASAVEAKALPDLVNAAAPQDGLVEVAISTNVAPSQSRLDLRIWDADGRNPEAPKRVKDRWQLGVAEQLEGRTLTWSIRLAPGPAGPSHFELRLELFQNDAPLPEAGFFYAGPLDGLEERSGRFHFRTVRPSV